MANLPEWLPGLVLLASFGGNWEEYLNALYHYYTQDFLESETYYEGRRLGIKRLPIIEGKDATFWHLVSEGQTEDERLPDMRRCERIRWPKPVIEHSGFPVIKVWQNERRGERRVCLWLETAEYLVVLAKRRDYTLLWTAYPVTEAHRKRKLQREYEMFKKASAGL